MKKKTLRNLGYFGCILWLISCFFILMAVAMGVGWLICWYVALKITKKTKAEKEMKTE